MSLDVSLIAKSPVSKKGTGVFIREEGKTRELQIGEIEKYFPGAEVEKIEEETDEVYTANITHNLNKMASKAGLYEALWRPDESGYKVAKDIIPILTRGLDNLKHNQKHFEQFNSPNGWGLYIHLVPFVENYLNACLEYPDAEIRVSR